MTKVAVVCGGQSSEREVSLRSGNSVARALERAGYDVRVLDTTASDAELQECDVVFPVLHGVGGEDGQFQARLEAMSLPFVGSGSEASKLCMDKSTYRDYMKRADFLLPAGATMNYETYIASNFAGQPHVVKPVDGGSSIDTHITRDVLTRDEKAIRDSFARHGSMIVEELIEGDELTIGVLGEQALPVIEIIPPANGVFDFANKYNGQTQEICPTPNFSENVQAQARELAERVHKAAGCRDLSRSDFILTKDGTFYLLETNTIPGLTDQSLFPKAALATGHDMLALCDRLVQFALSRAA